MLNLKKSYVVESLFVLKGTNSSEEGKKVTKLSWKILNVDLEKPDAQILYFLNHPNLAMDYNCYTI